MKTYRNVRVSKFEIVNIVCNRCGKDVGPDGPLVSIEEYWGYGSLKDGQCHEFDLCEACYDDITGEFKLPITIKNRSEW